MSAKPIKSLELHYTMIQFLMILYSSSSPLFLLVPTVFPEAVIVLSRGFIVSILLPTVSFSNHRPRLERYRLSDKLPPGESLR